MSRLPRRVILREPLRSSVVMSFDGSQIAWLESESNRRRIMVAKACLPLNPRPLFERDAYAISPFLLWDAAGRYLVYFSDDVGAENYRAFALDSITGASRPLTNGGATRALINRVSMRWPTAILLDVNARDSEYFDSVRIDLTTGRTSTVFINRAFRKVHADADLEPRLAEHVRGDGSTEILQRAPSGQWRPFGFIPTEDVLTTRIERISADGRSVFLVDTRDRDRAALVELDLGTGAARVLAADDEADIDEVVFDPLSDRPLAVSVTALRRRWLPVATCRSEKAPTLPRRPSGADLTRLASAAGGKVLLATMALSDAPAEYWLCATDRANRLFRERDDIDRRALRPMHCLTVRARDGIELTGYLTMPAGPPRPWPLVLLVHGGPYDRERWEFSPTHQWLSGLGYAVLSVNFRGSTGFGKSFVSAADGEWGGRMQDDLTDAAAHAVEQGVADPERIAVYGTSYGGYAALMAAARDAERFACFVDVCGPSDLATFMDAIPPYWRAWFAIIRRRLANPETREGQEWLRARSPIGHVDQMLRPLLIVQGLHDVRVRPHQSRRIAAALAARGVPVSLIVLPDEGHFINSAATRVALAAVIEYFLARHLGGAADPFEEDISGARLWLELGGTFLPDSVRAALAPPSPPQAGTPTMTA